MERYDIIVFENYHQAQNHKIDIMLIAHLLQKTGMKVGLLDIYKEDEGKEKEGIPIVHHNVPLNNYLSRKLSSNPILRFLQHWRFFWEQHKYLKAVRNEVQDMADRFYCGSYHLGMSSVFFELQKPCYYWGLRSNRFVQSWKHIQQNKYAGFRVYWLRRKFLGNNYQCLFVSNDIIKNEFIQLGIPEKRLIIREERCITNLGDTKKDKLNPFCTFLTIGLLRPEKRVELSIRAFKHLNNSNTRFWIIGKSRAEYEQIINEAIGDNKLIERKNTFLEYNDFLSNFEKSHFVVFADVPIKGTVTNGTMLEALINYRPIIAPNYSPYKDYIEKYGIGILYNPDEEGSLMRAMVEAQTLGCHSFFSHIEKYLKTILFDKVAASIYEAIK